MKMKTPDNINPKEELDVVKQEFYKNSEKAESNTNNLLSCLDKDKNFHGARDKTLALYNIFFNDFNGHDHEDKVATFESDIMSLFKEIDYNKIDTDDGKSIKNHVANIVQSIRLMSVYRDLLYELQDFKEETDTKEKNKILGNIKILKEQINTYKLISYKNKIINNLDSNMQENNSSNRKLGEKAKTAPSSNQRNNKPFEHRKEIELYEDGKPKKISGYSGEEAKELLKKINPDRKKKNKNKEEPAQEAASATIESTTPKAPAGVVNRIANKIVDGVGLSGTEKQQNKKYGAEILEAVNRIENENSTKKSLRTEIAKAELAGTALTNEQKIFLNEPNERKEINDLKTEMTNHSSKEDDIATKLADSVVLSPDEKTFYDANKDTIDAKIPALNEDRLKRVKEDLVDKIVAGTALTAEEEKLDKDNYAEINKQVIEKLRDELILAEGESDRTKADELKQRIDSRIRLSEKAKEAYKPLAEKLQRVLSNEKYQELSVKPIDTLSTEEKTLLDAYNQEIGDINTKLDELGPSGKHFADLEIQRANLAKASQEFQQSFQTKFPGAKILGVIGGMFGSKWSALKEGEKTKDAKAKMDATQIKYDEVRRTLMNTLVDEEHSVRKAFGQDLKKLDQEEKDKLDTWISNLNWTLVKQEREKLDDLKHVLEGTVRGSAMRRFGNWYSKDFMNFGPLKDNVRARNVAKRIVSAGVLSVALLPFSGAGAAGYFGYRMLRAGIGGVVGEGLAAGIARGFGGKMNEKGEFSKFADKRDEELAVSNRAFVNEMMEQFTKEEKPQVTASIMQKLNQDNAKAVSNYMNRQGNLRRAEMWARIAAGGITAYGLSNFSFDNVPDAKVYDGGTLDEVVVTPKVDDFALEGDFVPASSEGFIKTFMDLKKEMIEHYRGLDTDSNYAEANEFKNLSDEQIVDKLVETGRFDELTKGILEADNLEEFMKVAQDHGFWDPKGWGNGNIDSASVPKGSIVGMDWDAEHKAMQLYVKLPNGTQIPMDGNFQENLNKELGVNFINTDEGRYGGGSRPGPDNGPTRLPGTGVEGLPDPDMSLDEGDYAPGQGPEQGDPGSPGRPPIREGIEGNGLENPTTTGEIDKLILRYKEIQNPGSEHNFYLNKGFHEKGLSGTMRGSNEDVTTEYYDDAGNFYYTEKAAVYEKFRGGPHDIKNSSMYQEYHMLKTNYDIAQQEIIRLESLKLEQIRMEAGTMYEEGQLGPVGPSPEEIAAYEAAVDAEAEKLSTEWIDAEFEKDPWFGKTTPGEETKAWLKFKDDKVFDHIKNPEDYKDTDYDPNDKDEIRFKGSNKEEDFLESLFIKMSKYGIKAGPEETVSQLVDRVADIEARANLAK